LLAGVANFDSGAANSALVRLLGDAPPPPPPPPPTVVTGGPVAAAPVGVRGETQRNGKTMRLMLRVVHADGSVRLLRSPFPAGQWKAIQAALKDLDGNGVLDAVVCSARQGRKQVQQVVSLG